MTEPESRTKETDPEKLAMLYERFREVCLVEKEVWYEIFMPRDFGKGPVLTRVQDRYEVVLDDPGLEAVLDANIPLGKAALQAAIEQHKSHIRFVKKT